MRSWLSKNRHVYWLLGLIALALAYFVTQHLGLQYHVVHLPLDDRIPFCPVFVVFYILWYFYVPGCMLWACLRAKDVFCRQAAALFSGALLCVAVFVLYRRASTFAPRRMGRGYFWRFAGSSMRMTRRSTCFRACIAMRRWCCIW